MVTCSSVETNKKKPVIEPSAESLAKQKEIGGAVSVYRVLKSRLMSHHMGHLWASGSRAGG